MNQGKVIVYGGAFNPPTTAHYLIIEKLLDEARATCAELWLLPSGSRTDKVITVSTDRRLMYLDTLMADLPTVGVSVRVERIELERVEMTETIDTVCALARLYPDKQFVWAFGADSFLTMKQWRGGDELYESLDKIAISRPGFTLEVSPPRTTWVSVATPDVSSTEVRECLRLGKSVAGLVPSQIATLLTSGN